MQYGTAHGAAIGQFAAGKTGTTSNYGDAWFIGWDKKYTVAVWVGYPNGLVPMTNEYDGGPVLGGTFPALISHNFVISAMQLEKTEAEEAALRKGSSGPTGTGASPGGQTSTFAEATGGGLDGEHLLRRCQVQQPGPGLRAPAEAAPSGSTQGSTLRTLGRPFDASALDARTIKRSSRRREHPAAGPSPKRRGSAPAADSRAGRHPGARARDVRSPAAQNRHGSSTPG